MRLLCGVVLVLLTLFSTHWLPLLFAVTMALALLYLLRRHYVMSHLWRMLRWLMIPTVALHLIFTPGVYVFPQLPWSPSYEGMAYSALLSLHLTGWFVAAWVLVSLVILREWWGLLNRIPLVGPLWTDTLRRIPSMLRDLNVRLLFLRYRWRLEGGRWRDVPSLATAVVGQILAQGDLRAELHWLQGNGGGVCFESPGFEPPDPHQWQRDALFFCAIVLPILSVWMVA
ncbi:MAG: hypothetical protein R8J84_08955 [Mariprofundales bacterium]